MAGAILVPQPNPSNAQFAIVPNPGANPPYNILPIKGTDNGDGTASVPLGSVTTTFPYSETADAQAGTAGSAIALAGYNGATVDRIRVAPAGTNLAAATPGVLVIQGSSNGAPVPITGSISTSVTFPYSETADAQAATAASAMGLAGFNGTTVDRIRVAPAGTSVAAATAGVLVVQGSSNGAALPVSGTVSVGNTPSVAQSGTWTVQPGNTANTTPWLVSAVLTAGAATIGAVNQGTSPWTCNVSQFGGTNIATGTGAGGVGIPRVTVSNDSTHPVSQSGTWNIGSVTTLPVLLFPLSGAADAQTAAANQASALLVYNGSTWDRLKGDNTGEARVSLYGKNAAAGDTAVAVDSSGAVKMAAVGSGALQAIPAGTTNGTAIGANPGGNTQGVEVYVPAGKSLTYTIATSAPTSAPASVDTIAPPSGSLRERTQINLSGTAMVYITAPTTADATLVFRWI